MNDYFGWYTGFGGNIADRDQLSTFLDDLRRCYPRKAIAVTEYGAEANRDGPLEEKGTYAFQDDFVRFHLGVVRVEAVAHGQRLLGAAGVPRAPVLGRRQPVGHAAAAPEGPRAARLDEEARLSRRSPTGRRRCASTCRAAAAVATAAPACATSAPARARGGAAARAAGRRAAPARAGARARGRRRAAAGDPAAARSARRRRVDAVVAAAPVVLVLAAWRAGRSVRPAAAAAAARRRSRSRAGADRPAARREASRLPCDQQALAPSAPHGRRSVLRRCARCAKLPRRSWPTTRPHSPSPLAPSRALARPAACAAPGSSPASSTAARASRSPSRSTRARCARRSPTAAPSSRSPSRAPARRRSCSRTSSATRSRATRCTSTCCASTSDRRSARSSCSS